MRRWILALLAMIACAWMQAAQAQPRVRLLESFPTGNPIELRTGDTVYLRVAYESDTPIHIWIRPYYQGREVAAGSSPSRDYSGKGELLGFFFLMKPGQVDELRVTAGDGSLDHTPEIARWPIRMASYANAPPAPTAQPAWLATMQEQERQAQQADARLRASTPPSASDIGIFGGFMLAFVALGILGLGWPIWAVWRWRDGWRWWAAVPLAVIGFVLLRIVVETSHDPTSHNLFPFEIVMAGGASVLMMAVIATMRWWGRRQAA